MRPSGPNGSAPPQGTLAAPIDPVRPSSRLILEIWLRTVGWALPAAVALLLATIVLAGTYLMPARSRVQFLRAEVATLQVQQRDPTIETAVSPAAAPDRQLRELLSQVEHAPAQMLRIAAIANRQGISLPRGQYAVSDPLRAGIEGTAVTLNFVATYPQARELVEAVLRELPNVSMDRLTFERSRVQGSEVQVGLHLTLWRIPRPAGDGSAR